MTELQILPDPASLARAAADHFASLAAQAIARNGRFSVALAGGSTPKAAYALLAGPAYAGLDWRRIHIFFGDERCVSPDHPDSNYRMARMALLDHVPIPPANIHRMPTELPPQQAASAYESDLASFFRSQSAISNQPVPDQGQSAIPISQFFDLILLGLGDDGHTASLFPGSPALEVRDRWVVSVEHNHPPPPLVTRLSLTLPAINAAAQVTFLVSGATKAARLQEVTNPPPAGVPALPAQLARPVSGRLSWLVDQAVASRLNPFTG
jgi:6-phosphogluconolactonase